MNKKINIELDSINVPQRAKVFLLILLVSAVTKESLPTSFNVGGGGWWMCLNYVEEGTLYAGQPYCAQPPIIYYIGLGLLKTFGEDLLLLSMWILLITSNIVMYLLLGEILKKHGIYHPIIYSLLYLLTVYRFMGSINSTIACALFVVGYYILYYFRHIYRGLLAGVAFAFAVFTKYTTILPMLIVVGYAFSTQIFHTKNFGRRTRLTPKCGFQPFRDLMGAAIPILSLYLLLTHTYPNFMEYTFTGHQQQMSKDLIHSLVVLWETASLRTAASTIMLLILAYCVLKKFFQRDTFIYPLTTASLFFYGLGAILMWGEPHIGSYYMLPVYPFLVLTFMVVWRNSKKIFSALFLVTLIYPSIFGSPLQDISRWGFDQQKNQAIETIEYGLHYIPPQEGYVLTEGPRGYEKIFRRYHTPIKQKQVRVVGEGRGYTVHEDPAWAPELREKINLTHGVSQSYENLTEKEETLLKEIKKDRFSLIMYGPPQWSTLTRVLRETENHIRGSYCPIYVPNFLYQGDGKFYSSLYFQNPKDCIKMRRDLKKYYTKKFNEICSISSKAASRIKKTAYWNRYIIKQSCGVEKEFQYTETNRNKMNALDVIIMLLMYPPTFWFMKFLES
ncbi:MAG: hypothetical protein GF334_04335 [Candidatus Altiarchaeales archaeon]|nr:hypothetical protein [Candidatus Altiarchaeales archaeon]